MLGEGVVDVAVLHEAAKLDIGRPEHVQFRPVRATIVGKSNALICSKHGCVMEVNR